MITDTIKTKTVNTQGGVAHKCIYLGNHPYIQAKPGVAKHGKRKTGPSWQFRADGSRDWYWVNKTNLQFELGEV